MAVGMFTDSGQMFTCGGSLTDGSTDPSPLLTVSFKIITLGEIKFDFWKKMHGRP